MYRYVPRQSPTALLNLPSYIVITHIPQLLTYNSYPLTLVVIGNYLGSTRWKLEGLQDRFHLGNSIVVHPQPGVIMGFQWMVHWWVLGHSEPAPTRAL